MKIGTLTLIIVVALSLGCLLGWFFAGNLGLFDRWRPLSTPPGKVTRILGVDSSLTVYVATESQDAYSCYPKPDDMCEWMKASLPRKWGFGPYETDKPSFMIGNPLISPPGEIVDRLSVAYYPGPESTHLTSFLLLDDGTVWMWTNSANAYGGIVCICLGSLAGLVIGVVVSVGLIGVRNRTAGEDGERAGGELKAA